MADKEPARTASSAPLTTGLQRISLHQSLSRICSIWPLLWPGWKRRRFRPVVIGIAQQMHQWLKDHPDSPLTHGEIVRVMRFVTNQLGYLEQMTAGASRYDLDGQPATIVTAEEALFSQTRIEAIHKQIALRKANSKECDQREPDRAD
ncbi:ProQ/FINO family protein [Pectobacterium aroidearum]|uniref:ProQ/FINO family protein n=1 Tax=Pectobacterium aroidearum TaxID=1201031 RepID=UPI003158137E